MFTNKALENIFVVRWELNLVLTLSLYNVTITWKVPDFITGLNFYNDINKTLPKATGRYYQNKKMYIYYKLTCGILPNTLPFCCLSITSARLVWIFGFLTREKRSLSDKWSLSLLPSFLLAKLFLLCPVSGFTRNSSSDKVLKLLDESLLPTENDGRVTSFGGITLFSSSSLFAKSSSSSLKRLYETWPLNREASESLRFIICSQSCHFNSFLETFPSTFLPL